RAATTAGLTPEIHFRFRSRSESAPASKRLEASVVVLILSNRIGGHSRIGSGAGQWDGRPSHSLDPAVRRPWRPPGCRSTGDEGIERNSGALVSTSSTLDGYGPRVPPVRFSERRRCCPQPATRLTADRLPPHERPRRPRRSVDRQPRKTDPVTVPTTGS